METITLSARTRTRHGRGGSRAVRREGYVPAVVYGHRVSASSVELPAREFVRALRDHGANGLFSLAVEGQPTPSVVAIKEVQRDPISRAPIHIDFQAVAMDEEFETVVTLEVTGPAKGETFGGILTVLRHELPIRCLPGNLPEQLSLDVRALELNETLTVADLTVPDGVTVLLESDETLVACPEPAAETAAEETDGAAAETADSSGE